VSPRPLVPPDEVRRAVAGLLTALCAEHGIFPQPSLEWSTRMRRVLGRAYVHQNFIRLSAWLDEQQANDTLRHELAHIAAGNGKRQPPHGLLWREWAVRLGTDPRATSHLAPVNAPERLDSRRYWGLECPGCGYRLARIRVLPGLYHRTCGSRKGTMQRVMRGSKEEAETWVADR